MLALTLALAAASPLELVELADVVTGRGCPVQLVGDAKHPFAEAQIACDAYLSFAIVDELRAMPDDDPARAPRAAALRALLSDALSRGQDNFRKLPTLTLAGGARVSTSILARGYLLAMMGGMASERALPTESKELFDELAASVAGDLSRAQRDGEWLPSYAGGYWPCDHALAASGLALHGRLRSNATSREAGRALAHRLRALLDSKQGFVTQVTRSGAPVEPWARGTVLAWTAGFLAIGGHAEESKAFATVLARDFCEPAAAAGGFIACREFPRALGDRKADAVSGPIFMGYGSGATALAIAAFRATGDEESAQSLERLLPLAPLLANVPNVRADVHKYPLENAILLWGANAQAWR